MSEGFSQFGREVQEIICSLEAELAIVPVRMGFYRLLILTYRGGGGGV